MARAPFPTTADFGSAVSSDPGGIAIGAPAAGATAEVARSAQMFGRKVRDMAERAWTREGEADAARAIQGSRESGIDVALRPGHGIGDEAFNTVARSYQLAKRQAAWLDQAAQVETANGHSVNDWTSAMQAVDAAFAPTGDPETDATFDRFRVLERGQALGRVRQGQERARVEIAQGAYVETAQVAATALGQATANAGFDDRGAALIGASLAEFTKQLARFGPREAFSVGGIDFPADPTRSGAVSPSSIAQTVGRAQAEARTSWILTAADRSPDAAAKAAFAGQVKERWASGDAMFAGLDASDMDRLTTRLDAGVNAAQVDERAAVTAAGSRVRDLLEAGEYGQAVDMDELHALAVRSGDPGLVARVEFHAQHGFDVTPKELREQVAGGLGGGFQASSDFLLDHLEGDGFVANDGGRGRSKWGVTERSHPEAWRDGDVSRAEANRIARQYWDAIGGDTLEPDLAFVAHHAAYLNGEGRVRAWIAQSGGSADRFLQLEEAHLTRLAGNDTAKRDGWLARLGKERASLARDRAVRRAGEGYSTDPIGYARGGAHRVPLAQVPEYDPNAVFAGDTDGWVRWVGSRLAVGEALHGRDKVPVRVFDNEEARGFRDQFARDPASILTFTAAAIRLGSDNARNILQELGQTPGQAAADLQLADLSLDPGTRAFARRAVEGIRLLSEGAAAPTWDKVEGDGGKNLTEAQAKLAPALATLPDLAGPALATARAAAAADAARGQLRDPEHYVQGALGRNPWNNHFYGGVAEVNGRPTLLPTWVRADAMDEVVDWVARNAVAGDWGPVYGNGQPIPANRLSRMALRLTPDGRYQLIDPASQRPVNGRDGRPFPIDLNNAGRHRALRQALGDLIRPEF